MHDHLEGCFQAISCLRSHLLLQKPFIFIVENCFLRGSGTLDLETHFSYPLPQLHLPWGPLRQNFKTICNSYLKHCLKNLSPTMKMGETLLLAQEMISYPIFLSFCCHTFSFLAFFFFSTFILQVWCVIFP